MADEKKKVAKETSAEKSEKKANKKPSKFSPKNIGKAIARFFKDLRGETKKIVWPGRQMVIKSTGVVLASILIVGAGIWIIDYAISGAVTGINKAAENAQTTEAVSETDETDDATDTEDSDSEEETTEAAEAE